MLLCTDDDARILMNLNAYFDTDVAIEEKLANGEFVDPEDYYYKGTVDFKTSNSTYKWLERKICICNVFIESWEKLRMNIFII